jgi:hypothetical protein
MLAQTKEMPKVRVRFLYCDRCRKYLGTIKIILDREVSPIVELEETCPRCNHRNTWTA